MLLTCTVTPTESEGGLTLKQCLEHFTATEVLSEQDTWYCSKCKQHVRAKKTLALWSVPRLLVVHLKRFSDEEGYGGRSLSLFLFLSLSFFLSLSLSLSLARARALSLALSLHTHTHTQTHKHTPFGPLLVSKEPCTSVKRALY